VSDPQGLAFDPVAEDYDRGRAGWPEELLDGVEGESVLDLAAGTGKLTQLLVARYPDVTAVEPLAGMRVILERHAPRAEVLAGSAERIPLDDASVDAVFVAEAFHWFDSDAAAREIARVLRSGGTLLVCFNEWRKSWEPPIAEEARALLDDAAARLPPPGGVKVEAGEWKAGLERAPFAPLAERTIDHEQHADRAAVVSYYLSVSSFAQLSRDGREELRHRLTSALADVRYRLELRARVFSTTRL
jgi:ubiquinone/menaquinone biosynthesis C-methylase UbiE